MSLLQVFPKMNIMLFILNQQDLVHLLNVSFLHKTTYLHKYSKEVHEVILNRRFTNRIPSPQCEVSTLTPIKLRRSDMRGMENSIGL